ncbi:DUF4258 domain-containing protein [Methanohalophilus profundi]|uniref:DUF4258 domain-containing protein n=1 Tax=Methanohalophilus profundi TaxID=2138083 RepID=UPI00101CD0EF|nr:DUF4258 domain-containing protein [Methanohalophilus profundi]
MAVDKKFLEEYLMNGDFIISDHARIRMFQRNISTDDIIQAISHGEIIEDYSDDEPCPSALLLGFVAKKALHVVAGQCRDHIRIITVYPPAKDKWIDYKVRKDNQ